MPAPQVKVSRIVVFLVVGLIPLLTLRPAGWWVTIAITLFFVLGAILVLRKVRRRGWVSISHTRGEVTATCTFLLCCPVIYVAYEAGVIGFEPKLLCWSVLAVALPFAAHFLFSPKGNRRGFTPGEADTRRIWMVVGIYLLIYAAFLGYVVSLIAEERQTTAAVETLITDMDGLGNEFEQAVAALPDLPDRPTLDEINDQLTHIRAVQTKGWAERIQELKQRFDVVVVRDQEWEQQQRLDEARHRCVQRVRMANGKLEERVKLLPSKLVGVKLKL